jgi:hypothetical protein
MYNSGFRTAGMDAGLSRTTSIRLEPHGVNVVGGRTTGMGVGGFTLGGGLFWVGVCFNIHHGKQINTVLTVDTVTAFELVEPDGMWLW